MIQIGSKVRVVRPGQQEFRAKVTDIDMDSIRYGRRDMVKVETDPDQVAIVAAQEWLDKWVELGECIEEEPVMPAPPDALFPRPGRDDADALLALSDQLEELGLDPGAALLRDVACRIEQDVQTREGFAEFASSYGELRRSLYGRPKVGPQTGPQPPAEDAPPRDAPAAP